MSQDLYFANLTYGFDKWQNDVSDNYLYIPLATDGTSIKTTGDTITGYTWVGKYEQNEGMTRLLPSENRYQFSESGTDIKDADNGHSLLWSLAESDYAKLDYAEFFGKEAWNNGIINGKFTDDTHGWTSTNGTGSVALSVYSSISNDTWLFVQTSTNSIISATSAHVLFVNLKLRVTSAVCDAVTIYIDGTTGGTSKTISTTATPTINQWYEISIIDTVGADFSGLVQLKIRHTYADNGTAEGKVLELDGTYGDGTEVYDLTALVTAGVLPSDFFTTYDSDAKLKTYCDSEDGKKAISGYNIFNRDTTDEKDRVMIYDDGQYGSKLQKILNYTEQ